MSADHHLPELQRQAVERVLRAFLAMPLTTARDALLYGAHRSDPIPTRTQTAQVRARVEMALEKLEPLPPVKRGKR